MHAPVLLRADPVGSSLPLQKLLYFNLLYSPFFGAAHIALLVYKLYYLTAGRIATYILPVAVVVWCLVEIARLRLGYFGNLREKVPELSAFFLLTAFPSLACVAYLTAVQRVLRNDLPLDVAVGIPMIAFVVVELYYSYRAVVAIIHSQTADFFRLCQEESWAGAIAASRARGSLPTVAIDVVLRSLESQEARLRLQSRELRPAETAAGGPGVGDYVGVADTPTHRGTQLEGQERLTASGVGMQAASSMTPATVMWEGARRLVSAPLAPYSELPPPTQQQAGYPFAHQYNNS